MLYGLYLSAQGAEVQSLRQDVLANNLANASTTGFKRQLALFQMHDLYDRTEGQHEIPEALAGQAGDVTASQILTDFSPGILQSTSGALDVAIAGDGFLQVQGAEGNFLTRDGRLAMNAQGRLVTRDSGLPVLGPGGQQITVTPGGGPLEISSSGIVSQGTPPLPVGQLGVFMPENPQTLERVGQNLYRAPETVREAPGEPQIRQGFLEASGTNPVRELLDLIQTSRVFEANTNLIKFQDESLGRLLSSLPQR